jgi:hypothetical protein
MVNRLREKLNVTERRACRGLGQARSTQRRRVKVRDDEDALTVRTAQLAAWCMGALRLSPDHGTAAHSAAGGPVCSKLVPHRGELPSACRRGSPWPSSAPLPVQILTLGPGFAYASVRNREFHVAQQTCFPEAQQSKFLLAFPSSVGEDEPLPDHYGRCLYVTVDVKW